MNIPNSALHHTTMAMAVTLLYCPLHTLSELLLHYCNCAKGILMDKGFLFQRSDLLDLTMPAMEVLKTNGLFVCLLTA